jgi:CO/xanthine dehydrogenase FAD-binding subunit
MANSPPPASIRVEPLADQPSQSGLTLEAHTSLQVIYEAPVTPDSLHQTLGDPLTWQLRNESTVIKVVLSPKLAPQFVAALLALDARILFNQKQKLLADYLRRTQPAEEHLLAVQVPLNVPGQVWGEAHVARTPADEPIVSVMTVVGLRGETIDTARLALTGAWTEHARLAVSADLLTGGPLTDERIQQVAAAVTQEVTPPNDFRGSAEYRREMAAVLTRHALATCRNKSQREK